MYRIEARTVVEMRESDLRQDSRTQSGRGVDRPFSGVSRCCRQPGRDAIHSVDR